ncbi:MULTISPECIES: PLP-dependent transferase [Clostridium]|uniref:Cystathionine gamma-synthase n=2 Tax=Clostridium TaxID=1485 RepID=A0A166R1L5_9CLOT|nr:cystathionine gamma-synthase [Clostridium ljungdahlii]OAA94006.1 cystathionine gamma-synthase [Clostridium coskatii]OBR90175.1 cystathionine gamma-synthase [Clostridium coskatii]
MTNYRMNTKCVQAGYRPGIGETIANPALTVLDIEKFANTAHTHGVPAELIHISYGIEDKEDLISDISQALDCIK